MQRRAFLSLAPAAWMGARATVAVAAEKPTAHTHVHVTAWTSDIEIRLPATLEATANAKPAKIIRILDPDSDLLLLIVMDLTADLNAADPARQALISAIQNLPANCWVGVLRAQDGLRVLADPGADRAPVIQSLETLQISGKSALLEVVEPVAQLAQGILRKSPVRVAALMISDSSIYNYREDYTNPVINPSDSRDLSRRFPENLIREKTAKLAESLRAYSAPLFLVQVNYLPDRLNEAYQNGLRQVVTATGGENWLARLPSEIPNTVNSAVTRILSHWSIEVELPRPLPKSFTVDLKGGDVAVEQRNRFSSR